MREELTQYLNDAINKYSKYDWGESLKAIVEGVVDLERRYEGAQKVLTQRVELLNALKEETIESNEYGKLVKMFQNEIETQAKRSLEISSILSHTEGVLSKMPNLVDVIERVESSFEMNTEQVELLESLKDDVRALKLDDLSINSLKETIEETKKQRDEKIKKIQDMAQEKSEELRSSRMEELQEEMRSLELRKKDLSKNLEAMKLELERFESSMKEFEQREKVDKELFVKETSRLETALTEARRRMDEAKQEDLMSVILSRRSHVAELKKEIENRKNEWQLLKDDYRIIENLGNTKLEEDVKKTEEKLHAAERALALAPSLEEWKSAQSVLRVHSTVDKSHSDALAEELARTESQCRKTAHEVQHLNSVLESLTKKNDTVLHELEMSNSQLEQLKSSDPSSAVVNALIQQRQDLQEQVAQREAEMQKLRREQIALESRIESIKCEKDTLVDRASPVHEEVSISIRDDAYGINHKTSVFYAKEKIIGVQLRYSLTCFGHFVNKTTIRAIVRKCVMFPVLQSCDRTQKQHEFLITDWSKASNYHIFYFDNNCFDFTIPDKDYFCPQLSVNKPNNYHTYVVRLFIKPVSEPPCYEAKETWNLATDTTLCTEFSVTWNELHDDAKVKLSDNSIILVIEISMQQSQDEPCYVGLVNQGATCYMNSALQSLFHLPVFRRLIYNMETTTNLPENQNVALNLQRLFGMMQLSGKACSTTKLTESFGWGDEQAIMQHDVQEFFRVLLDNLEEKMKKTPLEDAIPKLFRGKSQQYVRCQNVDYKSQRDEFFYDISLVVRDCKSLEDSFAKYIEKELLTGSNQYQTDKYGLQDAEMGVEFLELPVIMQLHLGRFEFDQYTGGMSKIDSELTFPAELDMKPYIAPTAEPQDSLIYSLVGVLVHYGGGYGGHYYAFLRPTAANKWYKFNDSLVQEVSEYEAIDSNFGGSSPDFVGRNRNYSAYMLVYVKKTSIPEVFKPIPDTEVPEFIRDYVSQMKAEEEQRELEKEKKYRCISITFIDNSFVRYTMKHGKLDWTNTGVPSDLSAFVHSYDKTLSLAEFYDDVADQMQLIRGKFSLYEVDESGILGKRLLPRDDMRLEHLIYGSSMTLYVNDKFEFEETQSSDEVLVFLGCYDPKMEPPIRFLRTANVSKSMSIQEFWNLLRKLFDIHLDEFDVVLGDVHTVKKMLSCSDLTNGSFVIIESSVPQGLEDGEDDELDSEEEEEAYYAAYHPKNAPTCERYLKDKWNTVTMKCRTFGNVSSKYSKEIKLQFPKSLTAKPFCDFVSQKLGDNTCDDSCLLLYVNSEKTPLELYPSDIVWSVLRGYRTTNGLLITIGYFKNMDKSCFYGCARMIFQGMSVIVSPETKAGDLLMNCNVRSRLVGRCGDVYSDDAILSSANVDTEIYLEAIPDDDQPMTDEDLLLPVLSSKQTGWVMPYHIRVHRGESLSDIRAKHKTISGNFFAFSLSDGLREKKLSKKDILFDEIQKFHGCTLLVDDTHANNTIKLYN